MKMPPPEDRHTHPASQSPVKQLLHLIGHVYFIAIMASMLLVGGTEVGFTGWISAFTERVIGYSSSTAALALVCFAAAMMLARWTIAIMIRYVRPIRLMLASCLFSVIVCLIACFSTSPTLSFAAVIFYGFTCAALWPTMLAVAAGKFPTGGATMFALLATCGIIGSSIMPWIVGLIADHSNLRYALATVAICPALLLIMLPIVARNAQNKS